MSKYYKITLAHPYSLMVSSLSEPAPMIAPVLFGWMAIHPVTLGCPTMCNIFILGGFTKKKKIFFFTFLKKLVLQTY
jgi:hypothetical protein